jgi:hypothetical protein
VSEIKLAELRVDLVKPPSKTLDQVPSPL